MRAISASPVSNRLVRTFASPAISPVSTFTTPASTFVPPKSTPTAYCAMSSPSPRCWTSRWPRFTRQDTGSHPVRPSCSCVQRLDDLPEVGDCRGGAQVETAHEVRQAKLAELRQSGGHRLRVALRRVATPAGIPLHREVSTRGSDERLPGPANRVAGSVHLRQQLGDLRRIAVPDGVPCIREFGHEPEHTLARRPDQNGRPSLARPSREVDGIVRLEEPALVIRMAVAEQRMDDPDRILEPAHAVIEGKAELLVLRLMPASSKPEDELAAAGLVDCLSPLGCHTRVPEPRAGNEGTDLHVRHGRRNAGHHRPRFPDATDVPTLRLRKGEVVREPDCLEPDVPRRLGHLDHVAEARRLAK